jgi:tRNA A-37 threonylcarbamoyl transferase component Bud32
MNKIDTKVNFNKLVFDKKYELGHGVFGNVYKAYNGKNLNNRIVAKKTHKTFSRQLFSLIVNGKFQGTMFKKEVDVLQYLSKVGISPKIYYVNSEKMIYVIDKLDYTLNEMLISNKFKLIHLNGLIKTLKLLQQTPYKHNDLHSGNIMYSESKKKFYIIDWGIFEYNDKCVVKKKSTKKTKNCYLYNETNKRYLDDLFYYVTDKYNKNKKSWGRGYKSFVDIFPKDKN